MSKQRIGKIYVDATLLDTHGTEVAEAMASIRFLPMRVECLHYMGRFEMIGASPEFTPIQRGMIPPTYSLVFDWDEEGNPKFLELEALGGKYE